MKLRKACIFMAALIVLALVVTGCGGGVDKAKSGEPQKQPDKIVAKFAHVVAADTPKGKAIQYFADQVEKKSSGKMKVEVYPHPHRGGCHCSRVHDTGFGLYLPGAALAGHPEDTA